MKNRFSVFLTLAFILGFTKVSFSQMQYLAELNSIGNTYVPDARTGIFEVELVNDTLKIKTDKNSVVEVVSEYATKAKFNHRISLLPSHELGGDTIALVNVSVANIRSKPGQSQELATQALLGTPIKILEKVGGWYRVQTPDKYIGYLEGSSFVFESNIEVTGSKIIVTTPYTFALENPSKNSPTVSDLTWGNILYKAGEQKKYYKVRFPDGREAFVAKSNALELDEVGFDQKFPNKEQLVKSSLQMKGIPYLWGGTSWKGVDCSGFTRTVFLMNGIYLPRDASQQALVGKTIEFNNDFSLLHKGDLLFFGRMKDNIPKVTHVGMSHGGARFIRSSGMVRESSLDPNDENYDEFNTNRLLFVKRLEGEDIYYLNNQTLY